MKQHLRVKRFFSESENAVKSQLWIAVCVYVGIAILKAKFSLEQSYYENSTDFECYCFRENPYFYAVFRRKLHFAT